jgi:CDGSH-type Zn-finger protein/predicted regulator of Ras-like GTPase activity (Roadblock/LC7/MglB family)
MGFPQLIEEDFQCIDEALKELLAKSEANAVMLVEKAGHLIHQSGQQDEYPPDVLATLASNSFNAVQFMAGLLREEKFPGLYQQGERFSTPMLNVEENCMLLVIFKAELSVGAVRFYAKDTIKIIADQISIAQQRAPSVTFDLTDLNVADVQALFRRKEETETPAVAPAPAVAPEAAATDTTPVVAAPPAPEPAPPAPSEIPLSSETPPSGEAAPPSEAAAPVAAPSVEPPEPTVPQAPVMAKRGPYIEGVLPGTYWWCACGRSQGQPFCDGSHKGTGLKPRQVDIADTRRVAFCGCKRSSNPPFCDGTHSDLPAA